MAERSFTAVVHRCVESRVYLGFVPGVPGAYSQGDSLIELFANVRAVVMLLLENAREYPQAEFVGVQVVSMRERSRSGEAEEQRARDEWRAPDSRSAD